MDRAGADTVRNLQQGHTYYFSLFVVDTAGRRCVHGGLPGSLTQNIGRYAWVETDNVPEGCFISSSVVFSGAELPDAAAVDHKIITPFCEVAFG